MQKVRPNKKPQSRCFSQPLRHPLSPGLYSPGRLVIARDGKNSLLFEKSLLFLVCFRLNLVVFLVAFLLKKSPVSLLSSLTIIDQFS